MPAETIRLELEKEVDRVEISITDQIALRNQDLREWVADRVVPAFLWANGLTLAALGVLVVVDEVNIVVHLIAPTERIIGNQVIMALLGAPRCRWEQSRRSSRAICSPAANHDPHRHHALPLQAPAKEAEGGAVGGAGDRRPEVEGCTGDRPAGREALQRQPIARTACGHRHGKEAARSQGRLGRRRRRNTGEREGVPRPHDPARRVIAPRRLKMIARPISRRHWRSYGHEPLPTGEEALDEPFRAFASWFLRITCDRCGQQRMFSETHAAGQRDMLIRDIVARMRHDGCGGQPGRVELLTGIESASSRPVRRIVLVGR
jgi:hypothetical protein